MELPSAFRFCPKSSVLPFVSTPQRNPPHPLNQVPPWATHLHQTRPDVAGQPPRHVQIPLSLQEGSWAASSPLSPAHCGGRRGAGLKPGAKRGTAWGDGRAAHPRPLTHGGSPRCRGAQRGDSSAACGRLWQLSHLGRLRCLCGLEIMWLFLFSLGEKKKKKKDNLICM